MLGWLRRDPAHLKEHRRRMSDALLDYPVYAPPYRQGPNYPRHLQIKGEDVYGRLLREFTARGRENFTYFLEQRNARLTALGIFLAKFGVMMGIDDTGLAAVSAWCPGNCGALVPNLRLDQTRQAFFQLLEPWTGQLRGLNVIVDLGVFLGECLIFRNQRLHWIYRPGTSDDGSSNSSGFQIDGFKDRRDWLDPIGFLYRVCGNDEVDLRAGAVGRSVRSDALVGKVRDFSTR
jgi:hypothetical protein